MGCQHNYGTAGATGGGFATFAGWTPYFDEANHEPRWSWQQRAPKTWRDPNAWRSLWSFGATSFGASIDYTLTQSAADQFEPYSCDGGGCQSLKFLKGVCRDVSSSPLSGVILQGFRTSDDAPIGLEVQSRADGSYDLPTIYGSVPHYVVAYLPGSPDRAGTTVNTLTPTNVDGT
jgi:hypothetical protein